MIQINLLPDVKTKYIKAQRSKRLVLVSSVAVSGVALGIVVLLASVVYGAQKIQLSHYDNEIKKNSAELNKIDGLSKILTVQNQLTAISGLHAAKPVTSRIFTFLPAITPSSVQISSLQLDFAQSTMTIAGTANSIGDVNKFVDTLKFTKYTTDTDQTAKPAFTSVVLTSFGGDDTKASYAITLKFDPALFDSANKSVSLVVPKITSTRSETESPDALFKSETQ
jgi:Tfp pilus assembly protein PilN